MNVSDTERLNELEKDFGVLEQKCEDCKEMQDERNDGLQEAIIEVKTEIGASDRRNVRWHLGNLMAVIAVLITIILGLLKLK